jgi:hypothetical protein
VSRNLDVVIYRKLGYEIISAEVQDYIQQGTEYWIKMPDGRSIKLPRCSEDGNAMLELDREMRGRGWRLELWYADAENVYVAHYEKPDGDYVAEGKAETEPLARALAAYKALTGKGWTE